MPPPRSTKAPNVGHRYDPSGEHGAWHDRLAHVRGAGALLLLEVLAPGDDDVLPAVLVLDDAERVDLPFVHRRVRGADDVDLRERTERALARDAHLVAALHDLLHLAFHGEPGLERVLELPLRGGVAHALARQHDAAAGGNDHRLDAIADRHLDVAVGVLQFHEVDLGLAFAAHVDEGHLRTERDDGALDGLAPIEPARLDGRLEHRREIFFLLAHWTCSCELGNSDYTETRRALRLPKNSPPSRPGPVQLAEDPVLRHHYPPMQLNRLLRGAAVAATLLTVGARDGQIAAQASRTIPRTPDGRPNLDGIWQVRNRASADLQDHSPDT